MHLLWADSLRGWTFFWALDGSWFLFLSPAWRHTAFSFHCLLSLPLSFVGDLRGHPALKAMVWLLWREFLHTKETTGLGLCLSFHCCFFFLTHIFWLYINDLTNTVEGNFSWPRILKSLSFIVYQKPFWQNILPQHEILTQTQTNTRL